MSLVAYDSSDDSDHDDAPTSNTPLTGKIGGLFATLPAPKRSASESRTSETRKEAFHKNMSIDLPKPKKRSEPVKITVPEIKAASSDSDEDEPVRKKTGCQAGGLSSLLPQPKNLVVKETQRPLVPHTLTKRPGSKGTKPGSQAAPSASPSAIKAAAKSAALLLARQMVTDEEGSDDELAPENYFSFAESPSQPTTVPAFPDSQPYVPSLHPPPLASMEDAPLDFGSNAESQPKSSWAMQDYQSGDYQPQSDSGDPSPKPCPQDYYSEGYYQDHNPVMDEQEEPESSTLFNDEAFRRLQGKQNRGKEEIKFLEIKGDDQLSGSQQWMMKSMTNETEPRKSFSKKKGDQPTGQQRRKHQITYLIHQAKERELELKNSWADNKLTRRQTQAKYGF
ncbi:proline-rich protein PRCC [Electrophorus electricus]|uniref:Proline rich mitotic checkpoint control factor n=1 Tax=Electrophorus electricus TaxID=8005 RepID=A0AAY5F1D8_ELEEL|nr:proline-rich protein PRCC [Electrophorus electricus]